MTDDEQSPQRQTRSTRGGDGKFTRSIETAKRDAEACEMRKKGWSYRRIAEELGVDVRAAHDAVQRALKATVEEPAAEVRALELARLDEMYDAVVEVLKRDHVTVSQGRVVRRRVLDDNGDPIVVGRDGNDKPVFREEEILDDAPVLAAVDRLVKIQQRRAALLGLDAPSKQEVGGKLTYEIVGVDLDQL